MAPRDGVRDEVIPELDRLARENGMLRAAVRMLITGAEIQFQPYRLSGEYDPAVGLYGQSTATLPNGGSCDRHAYLRTAIALGQGVLAACGEVK